MIEITNLDHNGNGIGKLNNKIVFVERALPNEIVEINIIKEKKKYIEASIKKIIKKSKERINNPCPYYDKCGGCDLLHLDYDNQLVFKKQKIENIINQYLNTKIKINNIVGSDNNFYYRNKTTFQVKEAIGFYKNKSYDIIPVEKCLISNKLINKSINYLKTLDLKYVNKIVCKASNKELMIIIDTNTKNLNIEDLKNIASSIYLKINETYILKHGKTHIEESIGNYTYLVSPDSFFQINSNTCFKLYSKIKEYVGNDNNVLDLYCGTGSIGIFVSQNNNVLGIEINEYAIKDAIENAKINNIKNINFICGETSKQLSKINFNPDVIIVDPPRSGLTKDTIDNICKFKANKLIYVSCDPMTLARDLNLLINEYDIKEFTPFDMFPNTKHIESLVLLKRKTTIK